MSSQDGRSRQGSVAASPVIGYSPPARTGTASGLPPYSVSPPQLNRNQEQSCPRAKTPSDLLGIKTRPQEGRIGPELDPGRIKFLSELTAGDEIAFGSPETRPLAPRPSEALADRSEWDEDAISPLESRQGTGSEVVVGPSGSLDMNGSPFERSRSPSRTFTGPSSFPRMKFRKCSLGMETGLDFKPDTAASSNSSMLEKVMDDLRGVRMYVDRH